MSKWKLYATTLVNSIDDATDGLDEVNNQKVSEIALWCMILAGWTEE
jgi:hypothetical protein